MLNIILLVLILLIVFMQAVYGFFSSLIMAICTLVCTLLAFGYYELLASALVNWQPAYAHAGSLVALLVLPLILVRFLIDSYLPGNIVASVWVDRVCGGLMGLFTALLLTGTALIAMQMLPFAPAIMGYNPYDSDLQEKDSLMIDSPAFTLALVENLSAGSMGGTALNSQHEDLILESWGFRNRDEGAGLNCTTSSASLVGFYDVTEEQYPLAEKDSDTFEYIAPNYPDVENDQSKVYMARIKFTKDCKDSDKWWRIALTQIQLKMDDGSMFFPVGYLINSGEWEVVSGPIGDLRINRDEGSSLVADVLFRASSGSVSGVIKPEQISFRRVAVMDIGKPKESEMPDISSALVKKESYREAKVIALGSKLNYVARPVKAIIGNDVPFGFTIESSNDAREYDTSITREDSSVVGRVNNTSWVEGIVNGDLDILNNMTDTHGRNSKSLYINKILEPKNKKLVRLICDPLKSEMGRMANIVKSSGTFKPMIRATGQGDTFAVGIWVTWEDGGAKKGCFYYNPKGYTREDLDGVEVADIDPQITEIFTLYTQQRPSVIEFGLLFLAPDNSKITNFTLTNTKRYRCESPLSTNKPRR